VYVRYEHKSTELTKVVCFANFYEENVSSVTNTEDNTFWSLVNVDVFVLVESEEQS